MPRMILTPETWAAVERRLDALRPDARPQWGTLNAAAMVGHLAQTMRLSLGEVPVVDRSNWVLRNIVRPLAFELLPIPRGIKAPAEFDAPSVGELAAERVNLSACVGRFLAAAEATPERIGVSPLFGPMPLSYWRRIHGKHIAHHLRQFGL